MNWKKVLRYVIILLPWFISAIIFRTDSNYYMSLNLPPFAPAPWIFGIVWPILYILIAYSIYKTYDYSDKNYKINFGINYVSNQLYTFFFFTIKSPVLALLDTLIVLGTCILAFIHTRKIDNKSSYYLIPYILWNIFATILSVSIYIMN